MATVYPMPVPSLEPDELDVERLMVVHKALPSSYVSQWGVESIRAALNAHDDGNFTSSTLLFLSMLRDARMAAARTQRINTVMGLPREVAPSDETPASATIADELRAGIDVVLEPSVEAWLLQYGVGLGVSIGQLCWASERTPAGLRLSVRVEPWPMQSVAWLETERAYMVTAQDGTHLVRQGDPKWFVYEPHGARSWLGGIVRSLGTVWADRVFAIRDRAQHSEACGMANIYGKLPEGVAPTSKEALAFKRALQALQQHKGGAVVPFGYGFEGTSVSAQLKDTFAAIVKDDNDDIAVAWLGQTGTTTAESGLGQGGNKVHEGVRYDIVESDVCSLWGQLTAQVLRPWAAWNHGAAPPRCTRLVPDEDEDARLAAIASRHRELAAIVRDYETAGIFVDVEAIAKQLRVELPQIAAPIAPMGTDGVAA